MLGSFLKFGFLAIGLVFFPLSANLDAQEADKAKPSSSPKVELLEPGKPPLQKLRFTPTKGDKSNKLMKMKMSQSMGDAAPNELPEQLITITIEVKDVGANGDIDFEFTYTDIQVVTADGKPSLLAKTIEQATKPIVGTSLSAKVDSRGATLSSEYRVPEGLATPSKTILEGMKDSLKNLSSPLPEQPVGIGAKWKTVQPFDANGMRFDQITHTELTRLDSKGFTTSTTITQEAEPQEIKNGLLPEGTVLKLESLDTSGDGQCDFLFTELLPAKAATKVHSKTNMNFLLGQRTQKISSDLRMELQIEDAPPK